MPAERDAVVRAITAALPHGAAPERVALAGGRELHRVRVAREGAREGARERALPAGGDAPGPEQVLDVLAAGVGPAAAAAGTATALTAAAAVGTPYGLAVSAGIGGGFPQPPRVPPSADGATGTPPTAATAEPARLGTAVLADTVVAADLGAETAAGFVPVTELGFGTVAHLPPPDLVAALAEATGAATGAVLTVSTVTGTAERAAALLRRHPTAVAEAMEGFGVAEAAAAFGVPVLEVRGVSNAVGPRDRAAWRIGDALAALGGALAALVPVLRTWTP